MTGEDTMRPDEEEVIESRMDQLDNGDRSTFEEVMKRLGIDSSNAGNKTNPDREGSTDSTHWSDVQLPEGLRHSDIEFHRQTGTLSGHEAYQIGFGQLWMPFDYRLPEKYEVKYSRVERHHPPQRSRWARLLFPRVEYLVIVVGERYTPSASDYTEDA